MAHTPLSKSEQRELLKRAKKAIENRLERKPLPSIAETRKKFPSLSEKKASFVTLTNGNELRGCIGSIYPRRPLCEDIAENAIAAAFHDPRFEPMTMAEFKKTKIKISVLSEPEEIKPKSEAELLDCLKAWPGLILENRGFSAVYLPEVWEELPDPKVFLESLCAKAGLPENAWKGKGTKFWVFSTQSFWP